jgi:hypothetical protein
MQTVQALVRSELAPLLREAGKKLVIAGVAALTAKLAAGNPLCALAVGLAAVVAAVLCERLLGDTLLAA